MKLHRNEQSREGSAARRRLEFEVIRDQVKRRKADFANRLKRLVSRESVGALNCLLHAGSCDRNGYPRMNFRHSSYERLGARDGHVTILANRVFLILQLGTPIPRGHEASHTHGCRDRRCIRHITSAPYQENARTNGPLAGA